MARFPGAKWVGSPNFTPRGMGSVHGLVFHVTQGPMPGCLSWLQNPRANASAHFINPKSGPLLQLVDTGDKAWAEAAGNAQWVSVEHEGMSGDTLTQSQIDNDVALARWMHDTHGMPLAVTDDPTGHGIAAHCIGGASWGGHLDCPGAPIKAARSTVIVSAIGGAAVNTVRSAMARFPNAVDACLVPGGPGAWVVGSDGGVGAFGGARYLGSMGGKTLNAPMTAIVAFNTNGYWLIGRDGGVFAYGEAPAIAVYSPLFDQVRNGDRAVVSASWDGTHLTLIADDGASYGLTRA